MTRPAFQTVRVQRNHVHLLVFAIRCEEAQVTQFFAYSGQRSANADVDVVIGLSNFERFPVLAI